MPKHAPVKPNAPVRDESDARFLPVIESLANTDGFSLMESKSRATRGLMLNGKSFGMSTHGRLVLKLNGQRAAELIADGAAAQFCPRPDKPMKGWVEITGATSADWVTLANEAHAIAVAASKKPPKSTGPVIVA